MGKKSRNKKLQREQAKPVRSPMGRMLTHARLVQADPRKVPYRKSNPDYERQQQVYLETCGVIQHVLPRSRSIVIDRDQALAVTVALDQADWMRVRAPFFHTFLEFDPPIPLEGRLTGTDLMAAVIEDNAEDEDNDGFLTVMAFMHKRKTNEDYVGTLDTRWLGDPRQIVEREMALRGTDFVDKPSEWDIGEVSRLAHMTQDEIDIVVTEQAERIRQRRAQASQTVASQVEPQEDPRTPVMADVVPDKIDLRTPQEQLRDARKQEAAAEKKVQSIHEDLLEADTRVAFAEATAEAAIMAKADELTPEQLETALNEVRDDEMDTGLAWARLMDLSGFMGTIYGCLTLLECANVELAEAAEQHPRGHKAHGAIRYTVQVRPSGKRYAKKDNPGTVNYSHRFERRGHFKHHLRLKPDGEDNRLFARWSELHPERVIPHPKTGEPCIRLWTPPTIVGPEHLPFIPKRREVQPTAASEGGE